MTSDSVISLISNSGRIKILGVMGGRGGGNKPYAFTGCQPGCHFEKLPIHKVKPREQTVPVFPALPPFALPPPLMLLCISGAARVPWLLHVSSNPKLVELTCDKRYSASSTPFLPTDFVISSWEREERKMNSINQLFSLRWRNLFPAF